MANKLFSELAKGTYVGATSYTVGDFVDYNGSSYACILNSTGNLPTNTTYWALLAEKGDTGATGAQGPQGIQGIQGVKGDKGDTGDNATADAGTTTTLAAGESATVTNVGTTSDAIFNFGIPQGIKGDDGACVESVAFVGDDMVFTLDDASTVTLVGAVTTLKGETGDTGASIVSASFVGDDLVFVKDDSSTVTLTGALTSLKGDKGDKGDTGDIGIDWQGAWSAGTYTVTQAVSHNGSSWIATTTTTEEPSISATDWDLIALKGTDGAGSGDVSGPASSIADDIAVFNGVTGKLIKDGGKKIADLELVVNKSTTLDTDKASDTKYPSVKSVYDWAVGLFQTLANKVTSFQAIPDDTHYPSEKLVKDSLDAKVEDSIVDGHTTIAPSGNAVFDALKLLSGTFASGSTTYQKNDANITTNSILDIYAQSAPVGGWTVESYDGYFIITSTQTETSNIDFKYLIHNLQ